MHKDCDSCHKIHHNHLRPTGMVQPRVGVCLPVFVAHGHKMAFGILSRTDGGAEDLKDTIP